jgi:hypothetical protein
MLHTMCKTMKLMQCIVQWALDLLKCALYLYRKDPLAILGPTPKAMKMKEVVAHGQLVRFIEHIQKIHVQVQEALNNN